MTLPVVDTQPYAAALKAAMTAQGVAYGEGRKPTLTDPSLPYIVGWLDGGTVTDRTLRSRDGFTLGVVLQCYGRSPDAVRVAQRKGRTAIASLVGDTVDGRVLRLPEHDVPPPMQRDDTADPQLWWQTDVWRFTTSPA